MFTLSNILLMSSATVIVRSAGLFLMESRSNGVVYVV